MSKFKGFTLVELLIVILVIGILVAILLPVLSRVRRQADRLKCATNLRQVGTALLMYAQDNKEHFPQPALKRPVNWAFPPGKEGYNPEDWLYWHPATTQTWPLLPGRDITQSRIWRYIGNNDKALTCPIDQIRPGRLYPYSYSVNVRITGFISGRADPDRNGRLGFLEISPDSVKLSKIIHPAQKLLVVEESGEIIDDGGWDHTLIISVRHESDTDVDLPAAGGARNRLLRGNVFFVDGHVDRLARIKAGRPEYCDPLLK